MADGDKSTNLMAKVTAEPNVFKAAEMMTDAMFPEHLAASTRKSNDALSRGNLPASAFHSLDGLITQATASLHEIGTAVIDKMAGIKPIPQEGNPNADLPRNVPASAAGKSVKQ